MRFGDFEIFEDESPFQELDEGECVDISGKADDKQVIKGIACRYEEDGKDKVKAEIEMGEEDMSFEITKKDYKEGVLEK